ncbi:hypothetical protein [uncultured Sphingomonas sp.]|uniref:hypothetical protein n=1 Tax=uncultured Sphingomonas sp. TaxID=158754 RepID=UPI0025D49782|nr:hypothetical protein [uncultured Sphingomonas sp.]
MYKIVVDSAHSLIRLDMDGMLSPAEADRLVADLIGRIAAERMTGYGLIIDVSRCPVQAQDIIAAMRGHLGRMRNARAVAVVAGSMLGRLQLQRLFDQPFARIVDSYDEARAWVLSGQEPGKLKDLRLNVQDDETA